MTGAVSNPKKKKKKRKKKESLDHKVKRVGVALGIFFVVMLLDELGVFDSLFGGMSLYVEFVLYLAPWWVAGHDVLLKAVNNIRHGKVFDENFLMCVATIGAFGMVFFPDTDPHMAEGAASPSRP